MKKLNLIHFCRGNNKGILTAFLLSFIVSGCMVYEEAARTAINQAVGQAVEEEMGAWLAGYTDVMLYQLAYTQAFFLGGFGIVPHDFEEGQGAIWRVVSEDQDAVTSFTSERALLKRNDDGSSWWYLRFEGEDAEPVQFEILMDPNLQAREMYLRDAESGEVRHHEFAYDDTQLEEAEAGEASLEEAGYQTDYFFLEEWDQYHEKSETISIGAGTYNSDVLLFTGEHGESDHSYEYRWWVSENVPGHLLKFEYREVNGEGALRGEMTEMRRDYRPRFTSF